MKEFWLAILKNVITYVLMIIIVVGGGISIATQKFPPDWAKIVSAVNTIKDGYVSMINLRQSMGGLSMAQPAGQQPPNAKEMIEQLAQAQQGHDGPKDKAQTEMDTTIALLKAMSQQMAPQHAGGAAPQTGIDPELKKHMADLVHQNQQMIDKMDKIQTYLEKMHVYLTQTAPRQPAHYSAVQQAPPTRQPTSTGVPAGQAQPTAAPAQQPAAIQAQQNLKK